MFFFMVQQSRTELSRTVQGIDGRDSIVGHMDQWMEFSLVERGVLKLATRAKLHVGHLIYGN